MNQITPDSCGKSQEENSRSPLVTPAAYPLKRAPSSRPSYAVGPEHSSCWLPSDCTADLAHGAIMSTDTPRTQAVGNRNPPAHSPKAICSCLSTHSMSGLLAALADLRDWACFPPTLQMLAVKENSEKQQPWFDAYRAARDMPHMNTTTTTNSNTEVILHRECLYPRHPKYIFAAP